MDRSLLSKLQLTPNDYELMETTEEKLLSLPIGEDDLKKVWLLDNETADRQRKLARAVVLDWKNTCRNPDDKAYLLTLAFGGVMPLRYVKAAFESENIGVIAWTIRTTNYSPHNHRLPVPNLTQRLDQTNEKLVRELLSEGHRIDLIEEVKDTERSLFLTMVYLSCLLSGEEFDPLYQEFFIESSNGDQSLSQIHVGDENEQALLSRLRQRLPAYATVEDLVKISILDSKRLNPQPKLVKVHYTQNSAPNVWIEYPWESPFLSQERKIIRYLSQIYRINVMHQDPIKL